MKAQIAVLPGDGIGPEVVAQGVRALGAVAARHGHTLVCKEARFCGPEGDPLPPQTLALCRESDAVLLGAVSAEHEEVLAKLRAALGLFVQLRPFTPHPRAATESPLRPELLRDVDLLVVRDLASGFTSQRQGDRANDARTLDVSQVERAARVAAGLALKRRKRLASVDKSNVLESSRLWRSTLDRVVRTEFPGVQLSHLLLEGFAQRLFLEPNSFDVVVADQLLGSLCAEQAAVLSGPSGLLASASLGNGKLGLFEPARGASLDMAGRGLANPLGAISSVALLLRHALGLADEAREVETAVAVTLESGPLTADLAPVSLTAASTREVGDAVLSQLRRD